MKALFAIALLMTGVFGFSQRGRGHDAMKDMSPEQVATLETKKLTLALDLNDKQQRQIQEIHLEKAIDRQTRKEERKNRDSRPDADERYQLMSERLDKQIAVKDQMKDILNNDQFEKWEALNMKRSEGRMKGHCKVRRSR